MTKQDILSTVNALVSNPNIINALGLAQTTPEKTALAVVTLAIVEKIDSLPEENGCLNSKIHLQQPTNLSWCPRHANRNRDRRYHCRKYAY